MAGRKGTREKPSVRPKPRRRKPPRRTLVTIAPGLDVDAVSGVARYASQANWSLWLDPWSFGTSPKAVWTNPKGVIGKFGYRGDLLAQIKAAGSAVVNVGSIHAVDLPTVQPDYQAVGRLAGEHFAERGHRHVAALSFFPDAPNEQALLNGFREAASGQGRTVHILDGQQIETLLPDLPLPIAILGPDDRTGVWVLGLCQEAQLAVPEQVAVLAIGNEPILCDLATVPLSSVDIDSKTIGYEAASLLDRLMAGRKAPSKPTLVQPLGVVTRTSSDCLAIPHTDAAKALRYIWEFYHEPTLTPQEVAMEIGMTRRRLDQLFRTCLGRTISQEISHLRIDEAKRLLSETEMKCHQIARTVGFNNSLAMNRTFKRLVRCTPIDWRRIHQPQRVPDAGGSGAKG